MWPLFVFPDRDSNEWKYQGIIDYFIWYNIPCLLFDSYQTRKSMQLFPGKYKWHSRNFDQKDKEKNQCCFMAAEVIGETGNDRIYIFKTYRHVSRCVLFYPVDFWFSTMLSMAGFFYSSEMIVGIPELHPNEKAYF